MTPEQQRFIIRSWEYHDKPKQFDVFLEEGKYTVFHCITMSGDTFFVRQIQTVDNFTLKDNGQIV